jgi:hypothetical protein
MCPRYYSSGDLTGKVTDAETLAPITNALVVYSLAISDIAWEYQRHKRVKSAYAFTDSTGSYRIPSIFTLYIFYAAVLHTREASAHFVGLYHPHYKSIGRPSYLSNSMILNLHAQENTEGLDQIRRSLEGYGSLSINRADRDRFRDAMRALHLNDPNPNKGEKVLFEKLMR